MPGEGEPCRVLKKGDFLRFCQLEKEAAQFEAFFREKVGFSLRELQKTWLKRALLGISYALLAPTGVGKTTFGLTFAAYKRPKKSYLIFPTRLLAKQAYEKLLAMGEEALLYDSNLSKRKKEEIKKRIANGDFEILITTTGFLYKNFEIIYKDFEFVFVDDVDSILKSARNIDKVLMLLGFSEEDIEKALEFIDFKIKMASSKEVDFEEFERRKKEIEQIRKKARGVLLVSSATANPRSKRVKLFRELLGFEVSRPSITVRNIEDVYEEPEDKNRRSVELIKEFGGGGLVFLSSDRTKEELEEYVEFLRQNGISAQSYEKLDIEAFRRGEIEVAVGFASYRNPLARGIDLPDVIRYALFVGVPKLRFRLDITRHSTIYFFLLALIPILKKEPYFDKVLEYINYLKKIYFIPAEKLNDRARQKVEEIYSFLQDILTPQMIEKINSSEDVSIKKEEDFILVTADVTGYIQASGRVSRLYVGGLTKGLSYLLVDDKKAFNSLKKKVKWFSDIEFKPASQVDLKEIFNQIDEDRKKVRLALEGRLDTKTDLFKTALVIVESPNKARTIASFYGRPLVRDSGGVKVYEIAKEGKILNIAASKGHVFDLNKEEGYYGVLKNSHFVEVFEPIDEERFDIVNTIRELDIEVGEVYIATDPDVEGEKIGYDLYLNSMPFNKNIKRAEFHEVTPRAFDEALDNPREVDEDLVKAQLVRRVADRWIGFEISQYLQRRFGRKTLSAGRVQTAVLEWIVLREEEARQKVYAVELFFKDIKTEFVFESEDEAKEFYKKLKEVEVVFEKKEQKELFVTPFSTDTMLYEASKGLRLSPQEAMQLAQELFEGGFITYHRTDSIRVSPAGVAVAKEYIADRFGEEYFKPRTFSKAGGAHECIRPTRPMDADELEEFVRIQNRTDITPQHIKLYDLIFRRFIASQFKEAVVEEAEAKIVALGKEVNERFYIKIVEDGINLIWPVDVKDINEGVYEVERKRLYQRSKVPRYTYADIIKLMKERGVGRPSTYAVTIEKLEERRYIYQKNGVIYATKLGIEVYYEIKSKEKMYRFVNERYTRELEELMDMVERGEADYQEILRQLYEKIIKELHEHTV